MQKFVQTFSIAFLKKEKKTDFNGLFKFELSNRGSRGTVDQGAQWTTPILIY